MVSLKKNDKIIILVAVVVLAVSVVAVALYQQQEPTLPTTPPTNGENQQYTVDWHEKSVTLEKISEFAGKKTPYEKVFQVSQGNVRSISFDMSWIDDKTTFFGQSGLDTLTISVTTPDGDLLQSSNKSAKKTKEGTISFKINILNSMPSTEPIQANDLKSAEEQLLNEPYTINKWIGKDITVTVSVKIGESIFRPLKRMLDKGNNFDLQITYDYYQGILTPPLNAMTLNTGSDTPPGDDWNTEDYTQPFLSMILKTNCGRFF